jgi:hypothetical protein
MGHKPQSVGLSEGGVGFSLNGRHLSTESVPRTETPLAITRGNHLYGNCSSDLPSLSFFKVRELRHLVFV